MAPAEVGVGRKNDSFGWWIYHSNARVLFSSPYLFTTFYSMSTPTNGSVFRTCGADRNARVTGSSTPGSAIEGGFTTGRIDRSMDRWMDRWMKFGHLGRARADKKRRESRPRARWRLRKRTANARRRRQKRDAK